MNWKTPMSFGQYEGYPLIAVLAAGKTWLKWAYKNNLDEKYPELKWLKENIKPIEWNRILDS